MCTQRQKIPQDLPKLLDALHGAEPDARSPTATDLPISAEGSLEVFVERKTRAYNELIRLADICGSREQLFQVLDHMEEFKVPIDMGTFQELATVFTSGSRRNNPNR